MELQKETKPYEITFKPENRGEPERRPFPISLAKRDSLASALSKSHVRYLDLHDDKGNYLETIEKSIIKGIRIRSYESNAVSDMHVVCPYGARHPHKGKKDGFEECKCLEKTGMSPIEFEMKIRRAFPEVKYSSDIKQFMINEILN